MSDKYKILAAIATHNRLELLKRNIEHVRNQTYKPNQILVVDNDSNDGTNEWLKRQSDIIFLRQPNLGSAGAQAAAMKFGLENGYDYIWHMDDDGYPSKNALQALVARLYEENFDALNSVVLAEQNNAMLFCYLDHVSDRNKKSLIRIYDYETAKIFSENGLLRGKMYLYNGSLISVKLIEKIGFPDERLFINGEEVEYFLRMKKIGANVAIDLGSVYYHPFVRGYKESFFNRMVVAERLSLRHYFVFRNKAYIAKKNSYRFYDIKFFIAQLIFYARSFNFKGIRLLCVAYWHGIRENFLSFEEIKKLVGKFGIKL